MSDKKAPYDVGYKKPPKHSQFKKGQPSANPRGRKKKSRNFAALLNKYLQEPVSVMKNGEKKKMTAQEAIVLALIANAAKGNDKALERIFKFYPDQTPAELARQQGADLDRLLNAYSDEEMENLMLGLQQIGKERKAALASASKAKPKKDKK